MINGEVLYECGVDLQSNFTFRNGDIVLAEYEENLAQSVTNRLNTELNTLNLFYEDYGSVLTGFFGWKATEDTLHYIQAEIDNTLLSEPRLTKHESEVSYDKDGVLKINLVLYTSSNNSTELNLVMGKNGVIEVDENENVEEI